MEGVAEPVRDAAVTEDHLSDDDRRDSRDNPRRRHRSRSRSPFHKRPRREHNFERRGRGGRGRGRGRGGRFNPDMDESRRRREAIERMRGAVAKFGDGGIEAGLLDRHFSGLARALATDVSSDSEFLNAVVEVLVECGESFPHKGCIYAVLIGLINQHNQDLVPRLLQAVAQRLHQSIATLPPGHPKTRLVLRFVGELFNASVISANELQDILQTFVQVLQTQKDQLSANSMAKHAYTFLSCLPWVGKKIASSVDLLEFIGESCNLLSLTSNAFTPAKLNTLFHQSVPVPSGLESFLSSLRAIGTSQWSFTYQRIPAFVFPVLERPPLRRGNTPTFELVTKDLPMMQASGDVLTVLDQHWKLLSFWREVSSDIGDIEISDVDLWMLHEFVIDTIQLFSGDHLVCADQLLGLPIPLSHRSRIIFILFSEMLSLPKSALPVVFYSGVITKMTKADASLAKIVGRTINTLFQRLPRLDFECRDRFAEWFAFHLANVGLKFPWSRWSDVVSQSDRSPQKQFLMNVFKDVSLFHYPEHVAAEMNQFGPDVITLLPADIIPSFSFEGNSEAAELVEKINGRAPSSEIVAFLEERSLGQDLLMECILHSGSNALSHSTKLLYNYKEALLSRVDHKQVLIDCVCRYWRTSEHHQVFLIDRLVRLGIVDCSSVLNWLFDENSEIAPLLTCRSYYKLLEWLAQWNELKVTKARELLEKETDDSKLEAVKVKLEENERSEKEFYLLLFQRFVWLLGSLEKQPVGDVQVGEEESFVKIAVLRMEQVGRQFGNKIISMLESLESLIFFGETGMSKEAFQLIKESLSQQ